jgi:transposase
MGRNKAKIKNWREWRRLHAVELKEQGWSHQEIAEALNVSKAAVSQWMQAWREQGREALRARPRPGAPRRLDTQESKRLPDCLSHGAEAYGFRGEVWTCARVAAVMKEEFGVSYHKAHVSRLLKELRWTPQVPIERASQRGEEVIERWRVEVWPVLKKRRSKRA